MKKIGLLGGSFDPVHLGHVTIAKAAYDELKLDKVILMPAWVSPFKQNKKKTPDSDRYAMVELAVKGIKGLEASDFEIKKGDVSYTYDTLCVLNSDNSDWDIYFIVGTDSFLTLEKWYKGIEMLRKYAFVLAPRPGYKDKEYKKMVEHLKTAYNARIYILDSPRLDISSTNIRAAAKENKSLSGMVSTEVERYIYEHGLYK